MQTFPKAGVIEQLAGSPVTESALTVVGALAGGALAPLLPILSKTLASERQRVRVEGFLADVSIALTLHEEKLRELSDEQYKLVNESVLAALHTTDNEKLRLLQSAVHNALSLSDIQPMEATALSRAIRDISVEEAAFLLRNFQYEYIFVSNPDDRNASETGTLYVRPGSRDELIVGGLVSLGLLTTGQPTLGQLLRFSKLVGKLIVLLKPSEEVRDNFGSIDV